MLVNIDESILDAYDEDKNKFKSGLHHVVNAHFNKKHFVYITPKLFRNLKESNHILWNGFLNDELITKIEQISNQSILMSGVKQSVCMHINIYFNKISSPTTDVDPVTDAVTTWKYSINSNLEWLTNATVIYGENIEDTSVFEVIARAKAIRDGLKRNNVKFRKESTGGCGEVPKIVATRSSDPQELKSVCFIVADSDNKHPKEDTHRLLKECRRNLQDYNLNAPLRLHILTSREIENIIPIELLHLSLGNNADQSIKAALPIIDLFQKKHPEHYKYIDIKKGTCTVKVTSEKKCQVFFKDVKSKITPPCSEQGHNDCVVITPKLCEKTLSHLMQYMSNLGEAKLSKLKLQNNVDEWLQLEALLYSMALCNDAQLV
ncbi:hypothetical protein OB925_02395 [Aeromonas rivipollensis]|uniref:hypothetical protein n=1 Tax=Aeromonas rivipollensis TaxID=948519 RepID=UPI00259F0F32|nr:hypothetical protein [Aeromonas rivipollensis]MDM5083713.1 hypothetical protein [Aeromonas rivipollensis]MDM5096091.1 hypothetical protein [Aeromonas rivipollensis]MDM5104356.1 hypothetical protein [Aeromonas rivipollensis]